MLNKPSQQQIDFAKDLIQQLGYDLDDYDFDKMTKWQISLLIKDLMDERG